MRMEENGEEQMEVRRNNPELHAFGEYLEQASDRI